MRFFETLHCPHCQHIFRDLYRLFELRNTGYMTFHSLDTLIDAELRSVFIEHHNTTDLINSSEKLSQNGKCAIEYLAIKGNARISCLFRESGLRNACRNFFSLPCL